MTKPTPGVPDFEGDREGVTQCCAGCLSLSRRLAECEALLCEVLAFDKDEEPSQDWWYWLVSRASRLLGEEADDV